MSLVPLVPGVEPVDAAARRHISDDLDRNLFVEAGAGTGKTTVLVARVVNLVARGVLVEPSELVAITFTEAAAAELRDRIRGALERAARDEGRDPAERSRCRDARRRLDEAVITTLHGFAQRILAEHPLEVGLPPRFDVDDGVLAGVRFVQRWADFLDDLYGDPSAATDLLRAHALGLTSQHLLEVARGLHQRWDQIVGVDLAPRAARLPVDARPVLDAVVAALKVAGDRVGDSDDGLAVRLRQGWAPLGALLADALDAADEVEALRALAALPNRPGAKGPGLAAFWGGDKSAIVAHLNTAHDLATEIVVTQRTVAIEHLVPRLQAFTAEGVDERRRDGVLEFHDLLVMARDLLRTNSEVRVALAERYRVLLIDEFQDTDPIQLDIAFLLAAADPAADPVPWSQVELAEGKVVIVGDPKQSIYGFRGADISVWNDTRERFGDGVVQLRQSFRTVPQIVAWVNGVFDSVIGEGRIGSQPPYEELFAERAELAKGPAVILLGGPAPAPATINQLRGDEAEQIARLVALAKTEAWSVEERGGDASRPATRPIRYDDIALLVPTRTPLGHIERALDANGVPYRVESRSLVWATDAVRELLAVLAAVDDPADDVSVITALRSPGFACSDVDLVTWRSAGGRWDHTRGRPDEVEESHPVARAMVALHGYHQARNDGPVDLLVERIIRELSLVELTFAQRRPRDHWRRLRFVLDQARAFVEAGGRSLGELVEWAALQTTEGATVIETPAPEVDDDAVRILTIHGSKGLEFPMVVLAGLGTAQRSLAPVIASGAERLEVAVGSNERRFTSTGWDDATAGRGDAARDEGRRLLYVAATRARDHLVVGLAHPAKQAKGESYASELWAVAHDDDGPLSGLARRVTLPDQLTLAVGDGLVSAQPALGAEERSRWNEDHRALVASTHQPRELSPTAIAELGHLARPLEADDAGYGPDVVVPEADDQPAPAPSTMRRGGTARGRAVHAVLQSVDLDEPTQLAALAALHSEAEGIAERAEEVARLVRSALASPTVLAARASARRWREVTVAVPIGEGMLVEGYIDLLFEDADGGLTVVDYKTDAAITDAELDAAADRHRLQLAAYALGVEAATGRPVHHAVLVFARDDGQAVEREVTDLGVAVAEARSLVLGQSAAAMAAERSSVTACSSPFGSR
ncbi:MAG: UvrD-helicase domain-containing protein [Acidimicrobiales bacterium]